MTTKAKLYTVLACFIVLLLLTGAGFKRLPEEGKAASGIKTAEDLKGKKLGGVAGRMPASSSEIFFESILGRKLAGYYAYGNIDEAVYALKSGAVSAIWLTDVSADYLLKTDDSLAKLDTKGMADIENTAEPRFEFGMAAAATKDGKKLAEELNEALDYLDGSGTLAELKQVYIEDAVNAPAFTEKNMTCNDRSHKKQYSKSPALKVAVTGAVPPVELIDSRGHVYGFAAKLMDEIGNYLGRRIDFVVLDNETVFTSLMSGDVDIIFCYGAGRITTEGTQKHVMTRGYLAMQRYEFVTVE